MNRRIKAEMIVAKAKTTTDRAKNLRQMSRTLRKESNALVQRAKGRAMTGDVILPKKRPKRAA